MNHFLSNFEKPMLITLRFKLIAITFFSLLLSRGSSQTNITGQILEKSGEALPGATVKVLGKDSGLITGSVTDPDGKFTLTLPADRSYILRFSYLSYRNQYRNVELKAQPVDLGRITLKETAQNLSEVEVKTTQVRGEQKGDTTQFNAGAFKTNPDATAEDLVKKMPGITSDNNGIKVNGETVQKVLVDGKPFFGDDPNAALKNLPADLIDKVEVFDKASDQSQFTGFSDGEQQKTINLVTKKSRNAGQFGKVYGGYGADQDLFGRYSAGAAVNTFNNKRRVTLLLLSNNINQQNFSNADITGAMGNSAQGQGRGGNRSGSSPLMTSPQNGNTTTQSGGLNFSDEWGKKITLSGSYFFNYTDNKNHAEISRNYFTENDLVYDQTNDDRNQNQNHRFNGRLEYTIDSANKLIVTPSLSFQDNTARSLLAGRNTIEGSRLLSSTSTRSRIKNTGYDLSGSALYQRKFRKNGRTLSLNITTQSNERNNDGNYSSLLYSDTTTSLDQVFTTYGYTKRNSASLSYTEPLKKGSQLQFNYTPSLVESKSDKQTRDYNPAANEYNDFNSFLSNKYNSAYQTQKGGVSYRYNKDKLNLSAGADAQQSMLEGSQTFPLAFDINHSFRNLLPNAMLNYRFSKARNVRLHYRTSTNIPSINQLQDVLDVSNPLQVRSGNAALKQTFENNVNVRVGGFNAETARNIMLFVNGSYTDNYISNATYILRSDTTIQGYVIKAGSQLTRPLNLNGYYTTRAFFVYGFPLKKLKSNMNFNGGVNYNHTPTFINNKINFSNSYSGNGGIYVGSNISENLDFSLSYNGNYTIVKNTTQAQSDNSYFTHAAGFKVNWILPGGFVVNSDVNHTLYNGLSQNFNQQYFLWNAYFGYKFLKNKALEAKISLFDILNQNRSINRTITGAYTEDSNTKVLRRYALFTLTYTFKNFKNGTPAKTQGQQEPLPGLPPPGMRPGNN